MKKEKINESRSIEALKDFYWRIKFAIPRKGLIQIFLTIFILLGLPIGVSLVSRGAIFKLRAKLSKVKVFIAPESQTLSPDASFKIMVDPGDYKISFIRAAILFDQNKVNLVSEVFTSSFLSNIIEKTAKDEANLDGRIVVALGLTEGTNSPSEIFELASFP